MNRRAVGRLIFLTLALAAHVSWVGAAEPQFLELPAHELEIVQTSPSSSSAGGPEKNNGDFKVGDVIHLRILGSEGLAWSVPEEVDLDAAGIFFEDQPSHELAVGPLRPGKVTIPSLVLKNGDGKAVGRTQPLQLNIASAIRSDDPKPEEPAPPEPPVGLAFPWWVVALGLVFAALLLCLLVWVVIKAAKKYVPKRTVSAPVVEEPEDVVALKAIAELRRAGHFSRGQHKLLYFKVSEVLKSYVGRRFGFDAPESTSSELISTLDQLNVLRRGEPDLLRKLGELFATLDRVKFTDFHPDSAEADGILEISQEWVNLTKRPPAATTEVPRAAQ